MKTRFKILLAVVSAVAPFGAFASAQSSPTSADPCQHPTYRQCRQNLPTRTFYLTNSPDASTANEIITALRNAIGPDASVFLVNARSAIVARLTPEDEAFVQKLLTELDIPQKAYTLTYTLTEMDGNKALSAQHYTMAMVSGQNLKLKQGEKVPVVTGSYNAAPTQGKSAGAETQVTYLDVGTNFDSTLNGMGSTAMLRADIVQSNVAPQISGLGPADPIVHQTELTGTFLLVPGKPANIGSLDIPGSTRRFDIEVVMTQRP